MVTVEEAIKHLQRKYPNQRIVSGLDMSDFYAFSMMSRSANPTSIAGIPVNPVMRAIRKNGGNEFPFHIFHSGEGELKAEIDVTQYISRDDATFARRMKALMEGK